MSITRNILQYNIVQMDKISELIKEIVGDRDKLKMILVGSGLLSIFSFISMQFTPFLVFLVITFFAFYRLKK